MSMTSAPQCYFLVITLHDKRDFANVSNIANEVTLKWGDYLGEPNLSR